MTKINVLGRHIVVNLPFVLIPGLEDYISYLARGLNQFITSRVAVGKLAVWSNVTPYVLVDKDSNLDKSMCEIDEGYAKLRQTFIGVLVTYKSITHEDSDVIIQERCCELATWRRYLQTKEWGIGDSIPIYKLLKLLIWHVNEEFNDELVLRMPKLVREYKQLYVFRSPSCQSSLKPGDTSAQLKTDVAKSLTDAETIDEFHQYMKDEIKRLLVRAQFNPARVLDGHVGQKKFLHRVAKLFSDLRCGPRRLLVSWGPGGIGDVSDFTIVTGNNSAAFKYTGAFFYNFALQVSAVYCMAYVVKLGGGYTRHNLQCAQRELVGDSVSMYDCDTLNVINACLARFEIASAMV